MNYKSYNIRLCLRRCMNQPHHRIQDQKAYNTQNNGKASSRTQRKEAFFSKFFIIFLPVKFCKNNGHSITATIEDKDNFRTFSEKLDSHQRQPLSRSCGACCPAVTGFQDLIHAFRRILTVSDLDQGSGNDTHHIVKETCS